MTKTTYVTPRERRVSRNYTFDELPEEGKVTPRERRVSRNFPFCIAYIPLCVTPRERRVSRNGLFSVPPHRYERHASREACE